MCTFVNYSLHKLVGVRAIGKATPYSIQFDLPSALTGKAVLRFAICGTGTRTVDVEVNGKPAGKLDKLLATV